VFVPHVARSGGPNAVAQFHFDERSGRLTPNTPAFLSLKDNEVMGYADLAYLRGSYSMTFSLPGVPAPIDEQGKFLQIYRKQGDGSWKITREIYNSDLPLPAPPRN
jgi:ketosteroid isomerase-like protein